MNEIELYAELLTNIRTVTLVASLKTESNQETKVELAGDGQTITVTHDGASATLNLPTRIGDGGASALSLPAMPSKDLTLRLRVEPTTPELSTTKNGDENLVPWPATVMSAVDDIICVCCGKSVIDMEKVVRWKDLPNENWAEMMDFWHCHKPHEHEQGYDGHGHGTVGNDATTKKGYSATNKLEAINGVGFIDLSYFIFSAEDCTNVKINKDFFLDEGCSTLQCSTCHQVLGNIDLATEGWKLHKWGLRIRKEDTRSESFSVPKWISMLLLAGVENSGVRKFVVAFSDKNTTQGKGLLLWQFAESLSFSSSRDSKTRHDPTRAMKILWKPIDDAGDVLDKRQFSHEQLDLPLHVSKILRQTLERSAHLLPQTARKFQDWNVGLLERFDLADLQGACAEVLAQAPDSGHAATAET